MKIQTGKRYLFTGPDRTIIKGRIVAAFETETPCFMVRLDYWGGEELVWPVSVLWEDTEKPSILKRLIGAHA